MRGGYIVFAGECFYPNAGGFSIVKTTTSKYRAICFAKIIIGKKAIYEDNGEFPDEYYQIEWSHVVDAGTGNVLKSFGEKPYSIGTRALSIR